MSGGQTHPVREQNKNKRQIDKTGGEVRLSVSPFMFLMSVSFVALGMAYELMCSLTAVILHECAHAAVAKKRGYELNMIKLMPYGAALCGNADMRVRDELIIAAAGPIFNLALSLIFAAVWWLVPASYAFTQTLCLCNLYIGLFNLLPVFPLDGGRILLAALCKKLDRRRAYRAVRISSAVIGIVFIALFAVSVFYSLNVCFVTVGIFMLVSALFPDDRAAYYSLFGLASRSKRLQMPMETRGFAVSRDIALCELAKLLDADRMSVFYIYDRSHIRIGAFDEFGLIDAVKTLGYDRTAGEAMEFLIRSGRCRPFP